MTLTCQQCGGEHEATRRDKKFCSDTCRADSHKGNPPRPRVVPSPSDDGTAGRMLTATMAELEGAPESVAVAAALALANRIDNASTDTGSAYAALVRQLHATVAEALKDAPRKSNWLDELARRREAKAAGA